MQTIILIGQLFFTYFLSSLILFLPISKLCSVDRSNIKRYLAYSIGIGPLTISWLLVFFIGIWPYQNFWVYQWLMYSVFMAILLLNYKQLSLFRFLFQATPEHRQTSFLSKITLFLIFSILACLIILISEIPMIGSDQIDYMKLAQMIANLKTVSIYPVLDPNKTGGMIASWTHPLSFVSLYVWTFILKGSTAFSSSLRVLTPAFVIYTFFLLWNLFPKENRLIATLAFLILLSTPLYFVEAASNHIDAFRMYSFFLAFAFLYELINQPSKGRILFAGYLLGMCLFSHSIGLLAIPMFGAIYFLFSRKKIIWRLTELFFIFIVGLIFVLPRYIINFRVFHSLIKDTSPVWTIKSLNYSETLNIVRGIATPAQQWLFGFLKGFTNIKMFGLSYWILLLSLPLMVYFIKTFQLKNLRSKLLDVNFTLCLISIMVVLMFYSMIILSLFLHINTFIKNDRYMLTIQPFIAIISANILAYYYRKNQRKILNES